MRMRIAGPAAVAAMLATAGIQAEPAAAARRRVETISYATGPCFGACPVYKLTVSSDGRGVFEGERFTTVTGRHAFRATPAQWRAFRARLDALHGHGTVELTDQRMCKVMATDMPSVEVVWSGAFRPFTFRANYGCDRERFGSMFTHLQQAPGALPIAGFIGPR